MVSDYKKYIWEEYNCDITSYDGLTNNKLNTTSSFVPDKVLLYLKEHGIMYPRVRDGDFHRSFEPEVLAATYAYMEKCKKFFVYVIYKMEANWYSLEHHVKLHELCVLAGVPADRIVYINDDIKIKEIYDNWFKNQSKYKVKINMISYPFFLYNMGHSYKVKFPKYRIQRYKDREKLPTKKFMCLMGTRNWSRDNLWNYFLNNQDIKNDGIISYIHKGIVLPNSWNTNSSVEDILRGISHAGIDNLEHYYEDTYFSIILETPTGVFITEKTTKVLYHGHPFIMFNLVDEASDLDSETITVGALKQLRDWGFETFPELFDESYDELPCSDKKLRWENLVNNIDRLNKMKHKEGYKLCDSVYEKCVHNQKTLLDLKIPGEELLSKLKNIVEKY